MIEALDWDSWNKLCYWLSLGDCPNELGLDSEQPWEMPCSLLEIKNLSHVSGAQCNGSVQPDESELQSLNKVCRSSTLRGSNKVIRETKTCFSKSLLQFAAWLGHKCVLICSYCISDKYFVEEESPNLVSTVAIPFSTSIPKRVLVCTVIVLLNTSPC